MVKYITCCCLVLLLSSTMLEGQDLHFVQFQHSTLNLNPALTGIFKGDIRATLIARNQWYTVPVGYKTISGSVESKFYSKNIKSGFFSGGLVVNYDEAGDSKLGRSNIALTGSYSQKLSKKSVLSAGLKFSASQLSYNSNDLTFGDQFNGDIFEAGITSTDHFANKDNSKIYPDISFGANYRLQSDKKRTKFDVGAAALHINQPSQEFTSGIKKDLFINYTIHGFGTVELSRGLDAVAYISNQIQGPYREHLIGVGGKLWFNHVPGQEFAVQLVVYNRRGEEQDAWIPAVQVEYGYWLVGFTFDITQSGFGGPTNNIGGPELAVTYRLHKVRPFTYKICPIY